MSTTPLFDEPSALNRDRLAARLRRLAEQNIWIGTSSWKYEGWLGQIYTRERYLTRGRFSQRLFLNTCLDEYAETFPIVCGDFSFYQFPTEAHWRRLFGTAPAGLRYAFKVPEDLTAKVFPPHKRCGARAGKENPSFLDAGLFADAFLAPLAAYRERIAVLVIEFGAFSKRSYAGVSEFVRDLDRFLDAVPKRFRYSVEIRNPEYLTSEYFACLRDHGAVHVFNAWSRMPELGRQVAIRDAFTADFTVCRALLRHGRSYEEAVRAFSPYEKVKEENPEARQAMRTLIRQARETGQAAFIFVNNRLEGNAPLTIQAVTEEYE